MTLEATIFNNLLNNEQYGRKVIPFLKPDYFHNRNDKVVYELIDEYVGKYNAFPTKEALLIDLSNKDGLSEDHYSESRVIIEEIQDAPEQLTNLDWLVTETEKFCQDKAIYNAIMQSIKVMDDKTGKLAKGIIPQLLSDALAVSFDTSIGHDYVDDAESQYDYYHRKEERIPFDLEYFNKITRGGFPKKTLNIALAGTGVGKSLFMCSLAANNLSDGKNVLYITLEMSEEEVTQRIDANLLDVPIPQLAELPKATYMAKVEKIREKVKGKLIIKEYPTACAGSANFRHLLNELKLKKNFIPDIIYIDYLNICNSSRMKQGGSVNSYTYIKAIAEELRGLAVEFEVPIVSATQTTRGGYDNSDVGLTDTSESFGLPATADFMCALITTEELVQLNQIMVKQLKNRYTDLNLNKRFVIGVDKMKMRLYDAEMSAQDDIVDDSPVYDNTPSGQKFDKVKFANFK